MFGRRIIFHWAAALAAGGSIFMSFIVAPVSFSRFPKELAGDITGSLFPAYFSMQIVCGVLILGLLAFSRGAWEKGRQIATVMALVLVVCAGLNLGVVTPQARQWRKDESRRGEFRSAHRMSMILNLAAVLAAVGIVTVSPRLWVSTCQSDLLSKDESNVS